MDNLKRQIIDQIISLFSPLRNTYNEEINNITNDLINDKYDSLKEFVNSHYKSLDYSKEIKDFITKLCDKKLIPNSFKDQIQDKFKYSFIPFIESNILLIDTKPLNVKEQSLINIKTNTPTPILTIINHEYKEYNTPKKEEPKLNDIESLRKKILDAQLNYINNASKFSKELEKKDDYQIYQDLIDLNDIRFIQHSLSKLSINTLDRLLIYLENKTDKEKHSIDMFIIEVIKKYLHSKMH